jgi:hypothetical protein
MSRSVSKGNAFVDDSETAVPSDDVPIKREPSILSGDERRSEGFSDARSEAGKPLEKRRSLSTESGHRRAESFNEKEGYERGYASAPATGQAKQPVTNCAHASLGRRSFGSRSADTGSFAPHPSFIRLVRFLL